MAQGLDCEEVCSGRESRVGELCIIQSTGHTHAIDEHIGRLSVVNLVGREAIADLYPAQVRDIDGLFGCHVGHRIRWRWICLWCCVIGACNFNSLLVTQSKPLKACQLLRNIGNLSEKTKASVLCQDLSYLLDRCGPNHPCYCQSMVLVYVYQPVRTQAGRKRKRMGGVSTMKAMSARYPTSLCR